MTPTICDKATTPTTPAGAGAPSAQASPSSVEAGQDTDLTGTGFIPGEVLDLNLCSTPVGLGTATVDPTGGFLATVTIPGATTTGPHTIVVSSADGSQLATASLTVVAPSTGGTGTTTVTGGGSGLVRTGAAIARMAALAAMALILGLGLVCAARHRRRWPYHNR